MNSGEIAKLRDMHLAAKQVIEFTERESYDTFLSDKKLQLAVLHCITIIGEAANKISKESAERHNEIPWRGIVGMRNRVVHEYSGVNLKRVWEIVEREIPELAKNLERILPKQ